MRKTAQRTVTDAAINDELIGVLTAISIVSKRLARKLAELEKPPDERSTPTNEKQLTHQSNAV